MARSSIALLLLTVASTAGYKCLFIGHSFFVPISKKLPGLAASATGVTHEQRTVFSGGVSGSPSRMWESDDKRIATQSTRRGSNTRALVAAMHRCSSARSLTCASSRASPCTAAILDGGDIELFGMTLDGSDGSMANTTEGYENWMDYALSKNPSTIFMIGVPWPDFPRDYDSLTYAAMVRGNYTRLHGIFASLRANPKVREPYALTLAPANPNSNPPIPTLTLVL